MMLEMSQYEAVSGSSYLKLLVVEVKKSMLLLMTLWYIFCRL